MLFSPLAAISQINRSATELAEENVQDYIENKIFKDKLYKPVSFSRLKTEEGKDRKIDWRIDHEFQIAKTDKVDRGQTIIYQPYSFVFYLDEKMEVVKVTGYYRN